MKHLAKSAVRQDFKSNSRQSFLGEFLNRKLTGIGRDEPNELPALSTDMRQHRRR
jgi:hypothetical protein